MRKGRRGGNLIGRQSTNVSTLDKRSSSSSKPVEGTEEMIAKPLAPVAKGRPKGTKNNTDLIPYSLTRLENVLLKNNGRVAKTADELGHPFANVWYQIKKSRALTKIVQDANEEALDLAEARLIQAVEAGKAWAVQFMLSKKGRKRGYVDSSEIVLPNKAISFKYEVAVRANNVIIEPTRKKLKNVTEE